MIGFWRFHMPLVLASTSAIRLRVLAEAGLPAEAVGSGVDERAVEVSSGAATPAAVAVSLSQAKALAVSDRMPGRLVLGCDQTLDLDGERFTKPVDRDAARAQLERLSGRTHRLVSGSALARDGLLLWSGFADARLTMRPLSADFIALYLQEAGDAPLSSVGGYQYEGLGAHLFERVDGDDRTVFGLPLLIVLEALRGIGALAS
ncbi:Maf family protein [Hansschlegelia quercus]|uniref:Nucleoside triphosphate pyrophosphatase n=1 Tax=Hansschlegelia quercus TaxID=2528245 RepID=A0A4Q9GKS4_9HYPH|nr:Maf family protein [Hansschlegelia quercus]TBN53655.1 septum formation inhibitor Maf [Hansschlegelia quercus]